MEYRTDGIACATSTFDFDRDTSVHGYGAGDNDRNDFADGDSDIGRGHDTAYVDTPCDDAVPDIVLHGNAGNCTSYRLCTFCVCIYGVCFRDLETFALVQHVF